MTHDLPAVLPSFVPPDFGKTEYLFENLPTIDSLIQFSHFMTETMTMALWYRILN